MIVEILTDIFPHPIIERRDGVDASIASASWWATPALAAEHAQPHDSARWRAARLRGLLG